MLPGTATPLFRPRSRSSWLIARQSSAENEVGIPNLQCSVVVGAFPLCRKMFYSTIHEQETAEERRRMADQGLVRETACAVVGKLRSGEVTPLDLLDVLEKRIAEVDGPVNALPTLCFDRARKNARALMEKPAAERGLLAGLPIPIKDLTAVAGVLTTQGSPIYKDNIPAKSDILVEHLENNGGVIYAKSNTPEFGAGANTFHEGFGPTLNPSDTSRSAPGPSRGAAGPAAPRAPR